VHVFSRLLSELEKKQKKATFNQGGLLWRCLIMILKLYHSRNQRVKFRRPHFRVLDRRDAMTLLYLAGTVRI